jgi:hypothetical protein
MAAIIKANQSPQAQVQNAITNVKLFGKDLRNWSGSARRELLVGGWVNVLNGKGNLIAASPKLALVVASPVFRNYFEANPKATQVRLTNPNFEHAAVNLLVQWVTAIANHPSGRFGPDAPQDHMHLIKARYVAHKLGMEYCVGHFNMKYKQALRERTPSTNECILHERLFLGDKDELLTAVGSRLAYIRRRNLFNDAQLAALARFCQNNEHVGQAVDAADLRAEFPGRY